MMNYSNILSIWQLSETGECVPLSHTKLIYELAAQAPPLSGQEVLNLLRVENLVSANIHGEYILTSRGLKFRSQVSGDTKKAKFVRKTGNEWTRFRKILSYYIDCVHFQEKSQQYLFEKNLNKNFLVPALPFNWLQELGNEPEISLIIPKCSQAALNHLLCRADEDEEIYIGYPVSAFCTAASKCTCYSPVGLIPVDLLSFSKTTLQFRLRLKEAEINQQWLEYAKRKDEKNEFINTILNLHRNDDYRGMVDLLLALPYISDKLNSHHLELVLPTLKPEDKQLLCNTPVLFVGQPLQYSKTLKKELRYIRDEVSDEVLDSTALAYIFREPLLEPVTPENKNMPLPFIDSNIEQMAAVESALNKPSTKITGPPGTGKSQVAINIIANMIYNGKSTLFTSNNHKAVLAIKDRSHSILGDSGLELVNFCSNEDKSVVNPWYAQDLDLVSAKVGSLQYTHDEYAVQETQDAIIHWQEVETHFSSRNQILHDYAKCQMEYENLIKAMKRLFPKTDDSDYTSSEVRLLSTSVRKLSAPSSFSIRHFLKWCYWRLFGSKQNEFAMTYLKHHYPEMVRMTLTIDGIKQKFKKFQLHFEAYEKKQKELSILQHKAEMLPKNELGCQHLADSFKQIKLHLKKALLFKYCNKIQELIDNPEIVNTLKSIMTVLKSAKSPYFFQRLNHDVYNEAKNGFKLFATYFPGWATTLLSLTKAAPCIPHLFDCVIIDEASQCDIAPMIPALFRAHSVVLVGDPNQFPPVRTLKPLRNDYLKGKHKIIELSDQRFDFLENTAYDLSTDIPILLREHFRCADDIADFFNDEFYANQLRVRTNEHPLNFPSCMGYKRAVEWIDVKNSFEQEIEEVRQLISNLAKNKYSGTIGIVTPFKEHKELLQNKLFDLSKNGLDIMINTANGFQGGERDVIIFMLGYNDHLTSGQFWYAESADNRYIYNVAVSRAKACLIIVGDKQRCAESSVSVLKKLASLPKNKTVMNNKHTGFESPWEEKFFQALKKAGINCEIQYPVMGRYLDLAVITDKVKIDIEVDGVRWHTNEEGNRKLDDIYRDLQIGGAGWVIKRFLVHELSDNMDKCVQEITTLLESPTSTD